MDPADARHAVDAGDTALGIELGSTRIKAVLIGPDHEPLASSSYTWENQYVDRRWTYSLDDVWTGLRECYAGLAAQVRERYDVEALTPGAIGVSAMMHGYLAFDAAGELLTPYRTWRNTDTDEASRRLSAELDCNIPHRWSAAHLYQAVLSGEEHVGRVASLTTLAGYVHRELTGRDVLGIGDASGMFPVGERGYDERRMARFQELVAGSGVDLTVADLFPEVLLAGEDAGSLTEDGARKLDPTGGLRAGVPACPPEGDAGTGMVATSAVRPRTGNISAGTSIFAMVVLEGELSQAHPEVDLVATPSGDPVGMVHCNNGASELDAWVGLFADLVGRVGSDASRGTVFDALVRSSLDGAPDAGGLLAYNYLSGEPITDLHEGRPLFLRTPDSTFDLPTFFRSQLHATIATLCIGMEVLYAEGVRLDRMLGHGGLFTTEGVFQRILAGAIRTPVAVGAVAAEGGAWGVAVLAAYRRRSEGRSLPDYLDSEVFADASWSTLEPDPADVEGFATYLDRFRAGLAVQQAAVDAIALRKET